MQHIDREKAQRLIERMEELAQHEGRQPLSKIDYQALHDAAEQAMRWDCVSVRPSMMAINRKAS